MIHGLMIACKQFVWRLMKLWCNNLLSKILETYRKSWFLELPLMSTDEERVQNIVMFEADGSSGPNCTMAPKEPRYQYENNA